MSEVCGRPGLLHLESSRFVLRLIHTDYAKYYIAGHWKTGPKGLPAWGATPPTHTLEKHGREELDPPPPRVPTPMNFSKHLTDWLGVSTVELCGWKKRDLGGILRYVRAQKWRGSGNLLPPPLPILALPGPNSTTVLGPGKKACKIASRSLWPGFASANQLSVWNASPQLLIHDHLPFSSSVNLKDRLQNSRSWRSWRLQVKSTIVLELGLWRCPSLESGGEGKRCPCPPPVPTPMWFADDAVAAAGAVGSARRAITSCIRLYPVRWPKAATGSQHFFFLTTFCRQQWKEDTQQYQRVCNTTWKHPTAKSSRQQ